MSQVPKRKPAPVEGDLRTGTSYTAVPGVVGLTDPEFIRKERHCWYGRQRYRVLDPWEPGQEKSKSSWTDYSYGDGFDKHHQASATDLNKYYCCSYTDMPASAPVLLRICLVQETVPSLGRMKTSPYTLTLALNKYIVPLNDDLLSLNGNQRHSIS